MKPSEYPIDNTERMTRALEVLADAFQTIAKVQSERLRKEFPERPAAQPAQIGLASDEKRKEFSDKATDEWVAETEAALPPSRFAERFRKAEERGGSQKAAKKQ